MHKLLHIHLPLRVLKKRFKWLVEQGLQPEIACQGGELDSYNLGELKDYGDRLVAEGLDVTIHAPFFDLNPGSHDPGIKAITSKRFHQTLDVAAALRAKLIVFHPGFDRWRYDKQPQLWHDQSLEFWPPILERAEQQNCQLTLENIFEETPEMLANLLRQLDNPWLGHCFDVGHWRLFSETSLEQWFAVLGPHTRHIHLHDNRGKLDDHLPIGQGIIDFQALFKQISFLLHTPSMTLEAHNLRDLNKSLCAVKPFITELK